MLRRSKRGQFVFKKTHSFTLGRIQNIWGSFLLGGSQVPFPLITMQRQQYWPFQQASLAMDHSKPRSCLRVCLLPRPPWALRLLCPKPTWQGMGFAMHAVQAGTSNAINVPYSPTASGLFEGYVLLLWLLIKQVFSTLLRPSLLLQHLNKPEENS